jgi:hypothetical protein
MRLAVRHGGPHERGIGKAPPVVQVVPPLADAPPSSAGCDVARSVRERAFACSQWRPAPLVLRCLQRHGLRLAGIPEVVRLMKGGWFEVNIEPASITEAEVILCDVVDLLVHDIAGDVEAWFFFWEDAEERDSGEDLRLRVLGGDRDVMRRFLGTAKDDGKLAGWYEGSHGVRGDKYAGEAGFYGAALWEETYRQWTAMSELALSLIKLEHADLLVKSRSFHLRRQMHLYANQLRLDDITSCLVQAQRYLELRDKAVDDLESARVLSAIDRYLYADRGDSR